MQSYSAGTAEKPEAMSGHVAGLVVHQGYQTG